MQRVLVTEPNKVEVQPFEVGPPAADEVLIRTRMTLVSPGTERAFYMALPNTNADYPLQPGYSNIGEVVELGENVKNLRIGQRVACGAYHASHVVFPAVGCVPVPDAVTDEEAPFFNLIAIAMQGVRKTRIELGESVAVIGAGMIGLFAMQLAKLSGGLPVIGIDLDEDRLKLAEATGADAGLMSNEGLLANITSLTREDGADVVIEATGASPAVLTAFQIAATRGRVSLLGSARGETDGVNFYRDVHRKGLTIIGAHEISRPVYESYPGWWVQRHEHEVALDLMAAGRIQTQPFITHRFGWEDFPKAYAILENWDRNALGMLIDWTI